MLEPTEPASARQAAAPVSRKGPSFSGASRNTGPLPGSRSARKKKGLMRRTGIVFPAIGVAAFLVVIVFVASYLMNPSGSGVPGLTSALKGLSQSGSIQALEAEREQLIVMDAAASTMSNAAKPATVSPSQVIATDQAQAQQAAQNNSGSSGSTDITQAAPPDPGTAQQIGYDELPDFGFNQSTQWTCLLDLWNQESGWVYDAENPSGAYGIPQSLPGDKMADTAEDGGPNWETDPTTQIRWGLWYITNTYGTPCGAWDHEVADGWY
jgi:hypothetical protein